MNPIYKARSENVRYWLDAPVEHRHACQHLRFGDVAAGMPKDEAAGCANHMAAGAMCLGCWGAHCTDKGCEMGPCDNCGVIDEFSDMGLVVTEKTTADGWSGTLNVRVWHLCNDCSERRTAVMTVVDLRMRGVDVAARLWMLAGAPSAPAKGKGDMGFCALHPHLGPMPYADLLTHLDHEHTLFDPRCAACTREPGTVVRTAEANTEHGRIVVQPLAHFCAKCDSSVGEAR